MKENNEKIMRHIMTQTETNLMRDYHASLSQATSWQLHNALSEACMDMLAPVWQQCEMQREGKRRASYLSAEYLVGRMVYNNMYAMGILEDVQSHMGDKGVDIAVLEDVEDDAFGNGGLGRLAACFLDSAVTHNIPLTGYGLRYRYGLFKQSFVNGRQHETPDDWSKFGDPWSIRRDDLSVTVAMKTGDVVAVPYDMPVIGFGGKNIGTLRLWQCESPEEINFQLFNQQDYAKAAAAKNKAEDITKFLYPNDTRLEGKKLRVKQQYVLVSASMQDMLRQYRREHGEDLTKFAAWYAVQLNDTHPVMAVPELIRLLMLEGVSFERAFVIARDTFAYTNHTVMQEALEKWDISLLKSVCPAIVSIMRRIDARFRKEMAQKGVETASDLTILEGTRPHERVHMAQLAIYATHAINGVAAIHTELLKADVFSKWYAFYPERFQNKTNGITQRRWLGLCNPELSSLISSEIGDGFLTDLYQLDHLKGKIDQKMISAFQQVKEEKKRQLQETLKKHEGISVNPSMMFDVQVKRLHEYKRQLMNALSIYAIYKMLKRGELKEFTPTLYLFGAKAAPGYMRAKAVIYYINQLAERINHDPDVNGLMKVVFVQNYNCSYAEKIIPAADVSEQISPAGTEASGTGNMKLMLNGAVTLGTFDGANVEIVEQAGLENNYIFGATVEEIANIRFSYNPAAIYEQDALIRECVDSLVDGTFQDETGDLRELHDALLKGASWHQPDHYFVLHDFRSYLEAKLRVNRDYQDKGEFARKCLMNVASAGKFSSDRTIKEYAEEIWNLCLS